MKPISVLGRVLGLLLLLPIVPLSFLLLKLIK